MHGSDCPCLCTHCSHTAFHRHCAPPAGMYIRRFPRAPQPDFHPVTVIVPSLRFDLQMFHIFTCFLFCIVCFAYYIIQNEKGAPEYGISFSSRITGITPAVYLSFSPKENRLYEIMFPKCRCRNCSCIRHHTAAIPASAALYKFGRS